MVSPDETVKAEDWVIDAVDRLLIHDIRGAKTSMSFADMQLLNLPPGASYPALEELMYQVRVKLNHTQVQSNDESRKPKCDPCSG